jgi:hypothetical protein
VVSGESRRDHRHHGQQEYHRFRDVIAQCNIPPIIDPIAGARVRARRKWPVSGESGRVHDPIATRPKHDLQRDR